MWWIISKYSEIENLMIYLFNGFSVPNYILIMWIVCVSIINDPKR